MRSEGRYILPITIHGHEATIELDMIDTHLPLLLEEMEILHIILHLDRDEIELRGISPSVSLAILRSLLTPWCCLELSSFVFSLSSLFFGPLGLPILVLDLMPFRLCSSCSCLPPDTPSALLPPFGHGCLSACGDGYCCFLLVRWFPSSLLNPLPRGDSSTSFVFSSLMLFLVVSFAP